MADMLMMIKKLNNVDVTGTTGVSERIELVVDTMLGCGRLTVCAR